MWFVPEKAGELIHFSFIGGPLSNPGGFVKAFHVVSSCEDIFVLATMEDGQGRGPLDAFVHGHGVKLVLIRGFGVECRVCLVVSCSSLAARS